MSPFHSLSVSLSLLLCHPASPSVSPSLSFFVSPFFSFSVNLPLLQCLPFSHSVSFFLSFCVPLSLLLSLCLLLCLPFYLHRCLRVFTVYLLPIVSYSVWVCQALLADSFPPFPPLPPRPAGLGVDHKLTVCSALLVWKHEAFPFPLWHATCQSIYTDQKRSSSPTDSWVSRIFLGEGNWLPCKKI